MKVAFGYASEARVRGDNQDAYGAFEVGSGSLSIVCDGVGGQAGGQQAATLAVRTVAQALQEGFSEPNTALLEAITLANRAIYETGRKSHRLMGMSTTVVAVLVVGDVAFVAHVGDSRAYLIRDERAVPLTRDHTMVNMFVDNDLLSPEDAASHPEAHVLARSLGSERQVDVDLAGPLHLRAGDVLVVCSDGVHGAVDDGVIASGDWSKPANAARTLLRRVAAAGGTDNATLVAMRIGGRGEPGMAPTPLPTMENAGDALTPSSHDLVHAPELIHDAMPPALYPIEPEDEPTAYPEDATGNSSQAPSGSASTSGQLPPRITPRATPAPAPERPEQRTTRATPNRRPLILAGATLGLCLAILLAAIGYRWANAPAIATAPDVDPPVAPTEMPPGPPAVAVEPPLPPTQPVPPPATDPESVVPELERYGLREVDITRQRNEWFAIRFPDVNKNTKSKAIYASPLPSAGPRVLIANLTRAGNCAQVEAIVTESMRQSKDYAPLYQELWTCHEDRHHSQFAALRLQAKYDFDRLIVHLEGTPAQPKGGAILPYWYLPATDGIERRMDLWDSHARSDTELFDEVVFDAMDRSIVAARFHHDLMVEVGLVEAFASINNPEPGEVQYWARRVFAARRHLESRVGRLVESEDPAAHSRIRTLLSTNTRQAERVFDDARDAWLATNPGKPIAQFDWKAAMATAGLPEAVAQALLVGAGKIPPPDAVRPEEPKKDPKPRQTGPTSPSGLIPE